MRELRHEQKKLEKERQEQHKHRGFFRPQICNPTRRRAATPSHAGRRTPQGSESAARRTHGGRSVSGCTTRRTRAATSSSYTPSNLVSATISRFCSRETTPRRKSAVKSKKADYPSSNSIVRGSKRSLNIEKQFKDPQGDDFSSWLPNEGDCLFKGIYRTFDAETERRGEANSTRINKRGLRNETSNRGSSKGGKVAKASKAKRFQGRDQNYKADVLDQILQEDCQSRESSPLDCGDLPPQWTFDQHETRCSRRSN